MARIGRAFPLSTGYRAIPKTTAVEGTVPAGHASGTGAAQTASASVKPTAGSAQGTGTAHNATVVVVMGPVWTTPADGVAMGDSPELKFTMPAAVDPMFFNLQLDTAATFDTLDLRDISSDLDQAGWDFWNGTGWEAVAPTGVPATYAGNEARYTVQTPLSADTWFRRVRAGS